ncbi:hypothetical protein niasHT_000059 [Heterodera trifolii]|uniref:RING-type domain-containing protein n=1 Tax=Heterodera trifolii TaxID=157864 RepID=A0ABD2MCV4_9BILA
MVFPCFFAFNSLFNLFLIILLAVNLPHFVAIRVSVKPSNLLYVAEFTCYDRNHNYRPSNASSADGTNDLHANDQQQQPKVVVGREFKSCEIGEMIMRTVDLGSCNQNDPKAYIRITNSLNSGESKEFEIMKDELLARKASVVFEFDTVSIAHRFVKVYQSALFGFRRIRSMDFEIEMFCDFIQTNGQTEHFTIGSAIQRKGQKYVKIAIYEMELLTGCFKDKVQINIYYSEEKVAKKVSLITTRTFLLQNVAFRIELSQKNSIQPYTRYNNNNNSLAAVIALNARQTSANEARLSRASSSTAGMLRTNSSNAGMSRTNSSSGWLRRTCSFRQRPQEIEEKRKKKKPEEKGVRPANGTDKEPLRCMICEDDERQIAFIPCGHYSTCKNCAKELLKQSKLCAFCRVPITGTLQIRRSKSDGEANRSENGNGPSTATDCCIFCERNQCEIALIPCGHSLACSKCAKKKLKKNCPICEKRIKDVLRIYP